VFSEAKGDVRLSAYDFTSQNGIRLRLYLAHRDGLKPKDLKLINLNALDETGWRKFLGSMRIDFPKAFESEPATTVERDDVESLNRTREVIQKLTLSGLAFVAPRGVGPTAWKQDDRSQTQIRRRFMLLGQTLDGMRVWDVRRAVQALSSLEGFKPDQFQLQGSRDMAGLVLYAALFETKTLTSVVPLELSASHRNGPIFLNVLRFLDIPQTVAMVAEYMDVSMRRQDDAGPWEYPLAVEKALGWKSQILLRVDSEAKRDPASK
jgi:hypothetical protein